ncbi:MATE family multidrug resistance protein [Gemmobacter caeni]|uniref:Multidrug-efflux transporter n=1 Tax=Gemmobacter caeni TaxID=589035 RepID=A0A2T6AQ96_9RHOB|nr:MATE family efflux transporter [Gemmobacter caeni]PTX45993.1 MATE family multidrug resistance protein [Gemmobacter caeni]TWI94295.1 MATE family multidrug resistance protein [Gemmobacter caeni]
MIRLLSPITHLRALLALGLPLVGSHLAQMLLHVVDTVIVGWYGVAELAAVVIGGSCFFVVFVLGAGFAQAVMPMVAQALGRGDETEVRRATRMGLWLSIGCGLIAYPLFWWAEPILLAAGQKPEVAALARDFLRIAGLGLAPALLVMTLKSYLAALERTQVVLWLTLGAVFVNGALCYALVFGHWGAPELGVRGAGLASALVQLLTSAALALYAGWLPELRRFHLFQRFWRPDWHAMGLVFRLGWPIGLTGLAESGLFQATALMMGWIGTVQLAAHGIAMQVTALGFMLHLGLSNAATVRTGRFAGAGDWGNLRRGALVAIAISATVGLAQVALYLSYPEPIVGLFIDHANPEAAEIIAFGSLLLAFAAAFQLADAAQVLALGFLRGVHDTRVPMWIASFAYWAVGIPTSWFLAFRAGLGGTGLWLGLVIGLLIASALLMWRFWSRVPRPV